MTCLLLRYLVSIGVCATAGVGINVAYFIHYTDRVARVLGVPVAYFGVPFFTSVALSGIAALTVGAGKRRWVASALATVLSYAAAMILLWLALDAMDRPP